MPRLMRCAGRAMLGSAGLVAGAVVVTGVAATLAVGTGVAGAALLAKRLREERHGWRSGHSNPETPIEPTASDLPAV